MICFISLESIDKGRQQQFNNLITLTECSCYSKQFVHETCYKKAIEFRMSNCLFCNKDLIVNNNLLIQKDYTEIMLVNENGLNLQYVSQQTPELCLSAVKNNGYALKYVKDQTPEICLAAVKHDRYVLEYVKAQTPEICLEASKTGRTCFNICKRTNPRTSSRSSKARRSCLRICK